MLALANLVGGTLDSCDGTRIATFGFVVEIDLLNFMQALSFPPSAAPRVLVYTRCGLSFL